MDNLCPQCGAPVAAGAVKCEYCGAPIPQAAQPNTGSQHYAQPQPTTVIYNTQASANASWPIKSKIAAGILALLLGCFGIHEFYLGRTGTGVIMLLFCWTGIPALIGFIQGIIILCSNDENFGLKYHVRVQ